MAGLRRRPYTRRVSGFPTGSMRRYLALALGAAAAGLVIAVGVRSASPPPVLGATAGSNHLVVILMENKSYEQVIGNPNAPYLNGLLGQGRLFTGYYAVGHPSLPNYLALTSGDFLGCTSDRCPVGSFAAENLFHEMNQAGVSWMAYAESMPKNCAPYNSGRYAVRHNPPVYFSDLSTTGDGTCATNDVPFGQLATDLTAGALPQFAWITPNLTDDMHNDLATAPCALGNAIQDEVCQGDGWLSTTLPGLLSDNGQNDVTVLVVWDEAFGSASPGGGGHVPLLELGPGVPAGSTNATPLTHYGLAGALAQWFGLPPLRPTGPTL